MTSLAQKRTSTRQGPDPTAVAKRRRVLRGRHTYTLVTIASLLVLLVAWEIFGRRMNPIFASYPTAIAVSFRDQLADGTLFTALLDSLKPLLLGYLIAAVAGIPVGLLLGRYRAVEAALGIYVTGGYAMPMVAFIPLLILWFGLGFAVKVAVVVVMTVFPIVISTWAGVNAVSKPLLEVGKSFMASETAIMRKIILPATVPHIMTGLRLGIGRAVIGIVIAEFFTSIGGLGGLIINAGQRFDTSALFVPVVVLMVLGIGLTRGVGWLESRVAPWYAGVSGGRDPE
ncbi:ABC transporter permease [Micromonospora cremea]|uniref:NitT/TauT family transport system permease protein n=1 Tax=Micromonospora cremea TaxID=709881 RepID=A0A1N5UEF4_9ACTN|nr:ABC transporter permease [Micromonospora cremea]SIM59113.1 NitT/TauT family transport system permease protein [Micromonospora cremea]